MSTLTQVPLFAQIGAPLTRHGSSGVSQNRPVLVAVHAQSKPCGDKELIRQVPPFRQTFGLAVHGLLALLEALQNDPVKAGGQRQRILVDRKSWTHVPLFTHGFDEHSERNDSQRVPVKPLRHTHKYAMPDDVCRFLRPTTTT